MKRAAALIAVVVGSLALGSAASAGVRPSIVVTANPSAVDVGQSYAVSVSGVFECPPALEIGDDQPLLNDVVLTIQQISPSVGSVDPLGVLEADDIPGDFDTGGSAGPKDFTAPAEPGTYEIVATYRSCPGQNDPQTGRTQLIVNTATTSTSTTTTSTTVSATTTTTISGAVAPTAPTTTLATVLPETGQTSDGLVWAALAALLLGGGFVMVAARRS